MLSIGDEVFLNQAAQGLATQREALEWFQSAPDEKRRSVLLALSVMLQEAGATPDDVEPAAEWAGLKKTHTPVVLLSRGRLRLQVAKVRGLPVSEERRSFLLFLGVLSLADERRRASCGSICSHWWHQDLSDADVVRRIERRS